MAIAVRGFLTNRRRQHQAEAQNRADDNRRLPQRFGQGDGPGIRRAARQNIRHHDREDRRPARVQPRQNYYNLRVTRQRDREYRYTN